MYKNMLVLLDGSELAEVVFKYAQELSARLGLNLELLHVCTPEETDQLPMRRAYIERMAENLCAGAEQIRTGLGDTSLDACIKARGSVAVGHPVEEILKSVAANAIDLIMMSTRGRSGIKEWDDIGRVASKVIHASSVPVWLVPGELRDEIVFDTMPKRALVVPLSGSKVSEAAVPHALNIARQRGAETEIVLVGVLDTTYYVVSGAEVKKKEEAYEGFKEYLVGVADSISSPGLTVRTEVLVGEPVERLIQYLKENPPQLICMATGARTGFSRFVFGSVAENVIHMIKKTPMLLVPGSE